MPTNINTMPTNINTIPVFRDAPSEVVLALREVENFWYQLALVVALVSALPGVVLSGQMAALHLSQARLPSASAGDV
jgi:hypothetical protein